jgi:hypothetical protein
MRAHGLRLAAHPLALGLALLLTAGSAAADRAVQTDVEPNTLVPKGVMRYAPSVFPDRIVASPAQDASTGFGVSWRTVNHPSRAMARIDRHEGSNSRRLIDSRADVGATWWLLCRPSPAVISASHCTLVAEVA